MRDSILSATLGYGAIPSFFTSNIEQLDILHVGDELYVG